MQVSPGSTVAVFGVGGVGLSVVMGAALIGASAIYAIDTSDDKLERARVMGATHGIVASAGTAEELRELTGGGVDFSFDTTGVPSVRAGLLGHGSRWHSGDRGAG